MKKQTILLVKGDQILVDGQIKVVEAVQERHDRNYGRVVLVHFADSTSREFLLKEEVEIVEERSGQ